MLGKLFGSKTRVKILKLFLSKPDERFYIRQIARDLKLQLNSVRRELENLEQFGLLTSSPMDLSEKPPEEEIVIQTLSDVKESKKKKKIKKEALPTKTDKKYFRVNTDFILYEEIKALIIKAQVLYEKDFINKISKIGNLRLLILSGYFVNDPAAPVDLFIVGKFNKNKLTKLIGELESDLNREINYTIMALKEYQFRRDITDIFLYDLLERRNIVVIDLISRKP
ncbi:hypothetical protein DRH27_00575 [Candidatus Falkowbacteria bacterium]|nr:MAG: hypothetical protein DRH27_00575 [Candidatus Falkowbacteria bacterium]